MVSQSWRLRLAKAIFNWLHICVTYITFFQSNWIPFWFSVQVLHQQCKGRGVFLTMPGFRGEGGLRLKKTRWCNIWIGGGWCNTWTLPHLKNWKNGPHNPNQSWILLQQQRATYSQTSGPEKSENIRFGCFVEKLKTVWAGQSPQDYTQTMLLCAWNGFMYECCILTFKWFAIPVASHWNFSIAVLIKSIISSWNQSLFIYKAFVGTRKLQRLSNKR